MKQHDQTLAKILRAYMMMVHRLAGSVVMLCLQAESGHRDDQKHQSADKQQGGELSFHPM